MQELVVCFVMVRHIAMIFALRIFFVYKKAENCMCCLK